MVVAINKFKTDTPNEISIVKAECMAAGAFDACLSDHWAKGGEGARELANAVVKVSEPRIQNGVERFCGS